MTAVVGIVAAFGLLVFSNPVFGASQAGAERIAIGRSLLQQGQVEAAIEEFEKAAAAEPTDGAIQLNLAYAYERVNRNRDAIAAYQRSIALQKNNFYAHNNLGVLYDKQGMYEEAIAELQEAVKVEPTNEMAQRNLETAKKNKAAARERHSVIARAEQAALASPNDPRRAYELARVYATYGRNDEAISALGKAIQLGYADSDNIKADPVFSKIREVREFELLLMKK